MNDSATAALKAVLFGLCRNGISALAGLLITIGWLHSDQISSADISAIAGGAVMLAVALITSARNKTKVKAIIDSALALPSGTSYAQAKAIAEQPPDQAGNIRLPLCLLVCISFFIATTAFTCSKPTSVSAQLDDLAKRSAQVSVLTKNTVKAVDDLQKQGQISAQADLAVAGVASEVLAASKIAKEKIRSVDITNQSTIDAAANAVMALVDAAVKLKAAGVLHIKNPAAQASFDALASAVIIAVEGLRTAAMALKQTRAQLIWKPDNRLAVSV